LHRFDCSPKDYPFEQGRHDARRAFDRHSVRQPRLSDQEILPSELRVKAIFFPHSQ
jgi:hypothetical protein